MNVGTDINLDILFYLKLVSDTMGLFGFSPKINLSLMYVENLQTQYTDTLFGSFACLYRMQPVLIRHLLISARPWNWMHLWDSLHVMDLGILVC